MLPNPTSGHWLKKNGPKASWKITCLMEAFQEKLQDHIHGESYREGHQIRRIADDWTKIAELAGSDEANLTIEVGEAIHDAIDA
jgi:hypothetical protein